MSDQRFKPDSSLTIISQLRDAPRYDERELDNPHIAEALTMNKFEGLTLAVWSRWVALAISAVLLLIVVQSWEVLYYYALMLGLALVGYLQLRAGHVGQSRWELLLLIADLIFLVFILITPNPFTVEEWPTAISYKFNNFKYLLIFLAAVTLGYSWRTTMSYGVFGAVFWVMGAVIIALFGTSFPDMQAGILEAVNGNVRLAGIIDPNIVGLASRFEEAVIFLIIASILGINSFRMRRLLLQQADVARERANLARYFAPSMVNQLAGRDQPLSEIRSQHVAVMFGDIVGFSRLAETSTPEEVISLLREFFQLIEASVFQHHGTLDKYLGDGVMVTFGTPNQGVQDATNALQCTETLRAKMQDWNDTRIAKGKPTVKLSIGLHYGPVILGDIGSERRLEFATLGDTVNVASRLEELTRIHGTDCIISADLREAVETEDVAQQLLQSFVHVTGSKLRGRDSEVSLFAHKG